MKAPSCPLGAVWASQCFAHGHFDTEPGGNREQTDSKVPALHPEPLLPKQYQTEQKWTYHSNTRLSCWLVASELIQTQDVATQNEELDL